MAKVYTNYMKGDQAPDRRSPRETVDDLKFQLHLSFEEQGIMDTITREMQDKYLKQLHDDFVKYGYNGRGQKRNVKITYKNAFAIKASELPASVLAEQYGVCRETINHIRQGRRWKECNRETDKKDVGSYAQRGQYNAMSKLTDDDVRGIRCDGRIYKDVAETYGVSTNAIWNIKHGVTWLHITDPPMVPCCKEKFNQGGSNSQAKLTVEQVKKIRYEEVGTYAEIAKRYNVHASSIKRIKKNRAWKDV